MGTVLFGKDADVTGGARVAVTAASVQSKADVGGAGTRLDATVDRGGSVVLKAVRGAAVVECRRAKPDDPAPQLLVETIEPAATVWVVDE